MTLTRQTLFGPVDLVKEAIERIKEHEPTKGYAVKNSYGKDSGVVHKLMELAEVWEFTIRYKVPYCCLYDQEFTRMGCILCPQACEEQRAFEADIFQSLHIIE